MITLFLALSAAHASDDILFVGNSYTMGNDLPSTVQRVYADAGYTASTSTLASGGLKLSDHASRAADPSTAWYTKLVTEADQREWVVLQDQSQVPGFPVTQPEWIASRDGAVALDALISSASAETVFFLTWGRRDGDSINDWLFPDFSTMQDLLSAGYGLYAEACSTAERQAWIAPVGPAFAKIHDDIVAAGDDPTAADSLFYALYSGDGSHPSVLGTQLAAYVFYAALTGNSPVGLPVPDGLDGDRVVALQDAAAAVVFDPADGFEFPWEASGPVDTGDPEEADDTAGPGEPTEEGSDSGDAIDSGDTTDSGETGEPGGSSDDVGSDTVESSDSGKSSGCSTLPGPGAPIAFAVLAIGLLSRRQRHTG